MSRLVPLASILAAFIALPAFAGGLAIRTYPDQRIYSYEMDGVRGSRSALLQNLAVVNEGDANTRIDHVELALLRDGRVLQQQRVDAIDLAQAATGAAALGKSGALEAMRFQFQPQRLLGKGVTLAATPDLAHANALLLMHRLFAWRGKADTLRISVTSTIGTQTTTTQRELAIIGKPAQTVMRFPLHGTWFVGAGASLHTAHRWAVPEEFALDIMRLGADSMTYAGNGEHFADYHAYRADVLAAADGDVVAVSDGTVEDTDSLRRAGETDEGYIQRIIAHQGELLAKGSAAVVGNHVVIKHRDGEYSGYMHLATNSVVVKKGQHVAAGEVIGKLGSSGNSTEPHLHFQVCDGPDPLDCAGIPMQFSGLRVVGADFPRMLQSGDIVVAP